MLTHFYRLLLEVCNSIFRELFLFDIRGCFTAEMMSSIDTQKLELANFDPVLRSLGGHCSWVTFVVKIQNGTLKWYLLVQV